MSFSIKAIMRAWLAPNHHIICRTKLWKQTVAELERRGRRRHETGVFLLGTPEGMRRRVTEVVYYDELDPNAYATGVCVLHGDALAKLWSLCRDQKLMVVADVHTHPGIALQSVSDRTNPMVAITGHIAIIVPNFARWPILPSELGIYEYRGQHQWIDRNQQNTKHFFYTGFWS